MSPNDFFREFRTARPTRQHRPAVWWNGAARAWVALSETGELREFKSVSEAGVWAGVHEPQRHPRVANYTPSNGAGARYDNGQHPLRELMRPNSGQQVVWVRKKTRTQ